MPQKCKPCKDRGRDQVAHRMVGDPPVPMCDWCFKGDRHPSDKSKEGSNMAPKAGTDAKIKAVLSDYAAGMSVNAIAKKHGVTYYAAQMAIKASGLKDNKKQRRARGRRTKLPIVNGPELCTIHVQPQILDGIFAALAASVKAGLINKLPEVG